MVMFSNRRAIGGVLLPFFCFLLILGTLGGNAAHAVSTVAAELRPDLTIIIDGSQRTFYNASGQEVHPILYSGTTYLPVRAIGELMGKNVDWNQTSKTVTLSGSRTAPAAVGAPDSSAAVQEISVELRDDFTVVVDGTVRRFADVDGKTVYPVLYDGSTYLPVRAIGELMGKTAAWDGQTKTVTLSGSLVTDADTFSGEGAAAGLLSLEDAKSKALAHAGLTAGEVTFIKGELEREDGRQVYEIEFYTNSYEEYEYDIDACTGEILSFDKDADHLSPSTGAQEVTRDRAREIALEKVPGASASHVVKLKEDRDDGRKIYEVEIVYNGMEYEFEIDAATGTILEFDSEPIH